MNNSSNTTAVYMILKITIMALLDSLNMFFFCVAQQLTPHTLNIILRIDEMASFINKNKISINDSRRRRRRKRRQKLSCQNNF